MILQGNFVGIFKALGEMFKGDAHQRVFRIRTDAGKVWLETFTTFACRVFLGDSNEELDTMFSFNPVASAFIAPKTTLEINTSALTLIAGGMRVSLFASVSAPMSIPMMPDVESQEVSTAFLDVASSLIHATLPQRKDYPRHSTVGFTGGRVVLPFPSVIFEYGGIPKELDMGLEFPAIKVAKHLVAPTMKSVISHNYLYLFDDTRLLVFPRTPPPVFYTYEDSEYLPIGTLSAQDLHAFSKLVNRTQKGAVVHLHFREGTVAANFATSHLSTVASFLCNVRMPTTVSLHLDYLESALGFFGDKNIELSRKGESLLRIVSGTQKVILSVV